VLAHCGGPPPEYRANCPGRVEPLVPAVQACPGGHGHCHASAPADGVRPGLATVWTTSSLSRSFARGARNAWPDQPLPYRHGRPAGGGPGCTGPCRRGTALSGSAAVWALRCRPGRRPRRAGGLEHAGQGGDAADAGQPALTGLPHGHKCRRDTGQAGQDSLGSCRAAAGPCAAAHAQAGNVTGRIRRQGGRRHSCLPQVARMSWYGPLADGTARHRLQQGSRTVTAASAGLRARPT